MQKKDDKEGNKTANKEGKKESENKSKFWLLRMREYVFFLEKLVFSHNYAN